MMPDYKNDKNYIDCVSDILDSEEFKSTSQYIQHGNTTCLEHSIAVSYMAYNISKNKGYDYRSVARAGLLHDLFLYDWHKKSADGLRGLHGFTHAKRAADNAKRLYNISDIEYDIIVHHMWPLNPILPKSKEAWTIIYADKICSSIEVRDGIARLFKTAFSTN